MGQVTIYLPDDVEKRVRREAKRAGKSLSAYMVGRVQPGPDADAAYQKKLDRLLGSWKGEFPEVDDPPPRDVPSFDE